MGFCNWQMKWLMPNFYSQFGISKTIVDVKKKYVNTYQPL